MMFGFGSLMMLGFILLPLALIGFGIAAVVWLSQRQEEEE